MSYQVIGDGRGDDRLHGGCIVIFFMIAVVLLYPTLLCRMLVDGTLPGYPEVVRDARLSLRGHDFSRSEVEIGPTKRDNQRSGIRIKATNQAKLFLFVFWRI